MQALKVAFERLLELGAAQKAITFTESRRTPDHLLSLLSRTEYADGVVLFNGSNTDPLSRRIYAEWMEQHKGSSRVSGSRTADTRVALPTPAPPWKAMNISRATKTSSPR